MVRMVLFEVKIISRFVHTILNPRPVSNQIFTDFYFPEHVVIANPYAISID